jgi:protein SCO1/2
MKPSWTRFLILALAGLALGAAVAVFQGRGYAPLVAQEMPGIHVGGAFTLTDQSGKTVTEKSWPGKYKLVFFGFTHCPDTCPAALQKMAVIMQHLDQNNDPWGAKIVPLFITVDPARDTAAVMAKYVTVFNPHIVGLTGSEAQIKSVEEAYKVYAAKKPGQSNDDYAEYMEDHSAYVYLMSPDDKLLQVFSFDETAEAMIGKIKDSVE